MFVLLQKFLPDNSGHSTIRIRGTLNMVRSPSWGEVLAGNVANIGIFDLKSSFWLWLNFSAHCC